MSTFQSGILAPLPGHARYLSFRLALAGSVTEALVRLREVFRSEDVVGVGPSAVQRAGAAIPALREPPCLGGAGVSVPATPLACWCFLRGEDRGDLLHRGRAYAHALGDAFELVSVVDGFRHGTGRDLSGYEDGTENPKGDDALHAAFVTGKGEGLDGSSFVAVQRWEHDLAAFERFAQPERDRMIGRRRADNEELEDAPASAHVKRTAQESFEPPAFVLRRSLPFADAHGHGLMFVAFGRSFDAFEVQLRRMVGLDDGVTDALFRFSRPTSTSYFWCPPVSAGRLDLRAVGV